MNTPLRIAIVGGGPGGLTLARLLHVQGLPCTVFERDEHPHARPQGGTLDLHEDGGLQALDQAGLAPQFRAIARYEDQGTKLIDREGRVLFEEEDAADGNRPEADRTALRDLLLGSLPAGCVRWGFELQQALPRADDRWDLHFAHGSEGPFDLVVGADGTWSRLRPQLSRYQPQYSGLCFIEFGIDDVDRTHPSLAALVGRGKLCVEADGKALIVQRNGHSHLRGYAIFRVPPGWVARRFDLSSPAAVRAGLVDEFSGFAEPIRDLFRASTGHFAERPIFGLPVGHHWANRRGLTLLGDAAHVMSPFGGDGVNNAMRDALELARRLAAHTHWPDAVAAFETDMFGRVVDSAAGATEAAATLLSHDGQALTLETYRGHQAMRAAMHAAASTEAPSSV